ncbi:hypothetical protein [Mycolicibacterium litorale]|uniref:Uncharacterized protein n=1 Tax=Mycolicibacterium litorale TaxID=758802 RepID=A0AAD1MWD9_9MYCO|nr:hypothetical protein [Mycolicibacterium litorale]MCV7417184.1 hypothetical protein [Mycolicibacterium litorale]TDY04972.1 hypothetical protein BCL50_3754 [Mycolicibacterium litorale]BBY18402.1 hypothetical protein MLIT_39940 [Mycolicibacterium litorale]
MTTPDPVAAADAVVAAVDPTLTSPGVRSTDAVLVTGPWLAGVSSLAAALRSRLPEVTFVEADELAVGTAPRAVVFAVSAAAPVTPSDCELLDLAAAHTDGVVGVVTKTDAHHDWREVLATDRDLLAAHRPRYTRLPWVGAAAAPDAGDPAVDQLVDLLRGLLSDPDLLRRNRLRAWESQLDKVITRYRADGDGADRQARVSTLRSQRDDIRRGRRLEKSQRTIALRSQVQQARVQLAYFARNRCASVRGELQEDITGLGRRRFAAFEDGARRRAAEVMAEVDEGVTTHLTAVAADLHLDAVPAPDGPAAVPDLPGPPLRSRRLETRLMMLLGAGFGLGVALAVSRLFTGVAPGLTVAGVLAGAAAGLAVAVWVVGIRGLLHDRGVLDRWVVDLTAALRSAAEEAVATRVVAAEAALTGSLAADEAAESETAAGRIAEIDAELREHAAATVRAAALRDRRLPGLLRARDAVRAALDDDFCGELTDASERNSGKTVGY